MQKQRERETMGALETREPKQSYKEWRSKTQNRNPKIQQTQKSNLKEKKETNNTIIGQTQGVILRLDKGKIKIKRITTGRQNLGFSEVNKTKVMDIKADEPSQITKYNTLSVNK